MQKELSTLTKNSNKKFLSLYNYSQGSIDKSQLWDLPKIPLKNFAIGAYPEFSAKLAASKPTETSNVLSFYHRGTLFLQSVRKVKT